MSAVEELHDEDRNADLIGHRIVSGNNPDHTLVVTGSAVPGGQYVNCDVLNVYGAKVGATVRHEGLVRRHKQAAGAAA